MTDVVDQRRDKKRTLQLRYYKRVYHEVKLNEMVVVVVILVWWLLQMFLHESVDVGLSWMFSCEQLVLHEGVAEGKTLLDSKLFLEKRAEQRQHSTQLLGTHIYWYQVLVW